MAVIGNSDIRVKVDSLEEILRTLKNIEKALEPKTFEVHVGPENFKVAEGLTAKKLAEDLANQFRESHGVSESWAKGLPVGKKGFLTKTAKELVTGDEVSFDEDERVWHRVGKVLVLAHGSVWVYDTEDNLIDRVPADRKVPVYHD